MPVKKETKINSASKNVIKNTETGDAGDDFEAWMRSRQLLKPDDQLELTEAELSEEISRVLTVSNSNALRNLVVYNFRLGEYVVLPPVGNTVTLFKFTGTSLHIDSEEARDQIAELGEEAFIYPASKINDRMSKSRVSVPLIDQRDDIGDMDDADDDAQDKKDGDQDQAATDDVGDEGEDIEDGEEEGEEEAGDVNPEDQVAAPAPTKKRKLINQFNYCERAALTFTNPQRGVETQTIPPPRSVYGGNVFQWVIYDSYAEDYAAQLREKEKEKKPGALASKKEDFKRKADKTQAAEELNRKYLKCWQILERMINQNIYDEIAQDYRYWEDPSDEFREGEGSLLPLWKFSYEKTKKMNVTDLLFNPHYYDLYAVCFGSHDFMKQNSEGSVCLFTIKNPSYPDYIITCESGVMCCDIHPKYPFLLAIGMYDGSVAVYNLQEMGKEPLYLSQGNESKHAECVWEIKWGPDMPDGEINFYSVSSDGRVFNWVLMQNKLALTTIITLYLDQPPVAGPDGAELKLKACGTSMIFHPKDPEIFLVGTEEGLIYKCSTAYSSKYLMTYNAHYLSVYRIDFNKYNSNIFVSCSGDWRIKIWEDMRQEPLFIFDLGSSVGDVKWAPYSSTVFAAVTSEGKVFVFDLNVNKYKAISIQAIVPKRKNKLTRLEFNSKLPFIIVGDEKGTTISLKLSPNLRVMCKPPKKQLWLDQTTMQNQKLEKLLSLVRELPEGEELNDESATDAT